MQNLRAPIPIISQLKLPKIKRTLPSSGVEFYFLAADVIQLKAREASDITGWCITFNILRPVVNIENFVFASTLIGVAIFDYFTSYITKGILMPPEYTGFLKICGYHKF